MLTLKDNRNPVSTDLTDNSYVLAPGAAGEKSSGSFSIPEQFKRLGGEPDVYSDPGHGTRVVMLAPWDDVEDDSASESRMARPHAGAGSDPAETKPSARPLRVLIVDDHIVMRQGLAALLELEDDLQVVGEASDGLEGIEKAKEIRPDVIVMDITMPGMNGIEATRVICREVPDCRIVALSMHESADMAAAMHEAGAAAYLAKGGPADQLLDAIRNS